MNAKLMAVRQQIDTTDRELLKLLALRMEYVTTVGKIKRKENLPALQQSRWQEVLLDRIKEGQRLGLSAQLIQAIWECIHKEALRIEENI